ncbi:hypothetical protein CKO_04341 [Citrobacter koseri ATCC BAA-895]|uniref:Uncharacterized protein n=1 Tax=Citrobacter koseri (strain ATCC BAA-895 / CDC 4225-83 / SGSC4696) TaxID=290338 RepID=A8API5_CITK8|nr:hypothetical protein CKO_04341 [Citrobacter koseri ATCC BAA-895]
MFYLIALLCPEYHALCAFVDGAYVRDLILRPQGKGAMIARIFSCLYGAAWDDHITLTSPSTSPFCATIAPFFDLPSFSHHAVRAAHAHCGTTVRSEAVCFY